MARNQNQKSETPAYFLTALVIVAVVVLLMANKTVPSALYDFGLVSLGVAGGVSIPKKGAVE